MVVARQLGANDLPEIYSAFKARFIGEAVMVHSFFQLSTWHVEDLKYGVTLGLPRFFSVGEELLWIS